MHRLRAVLIACLVVLNAIAPVWASGDADLDPSRPEGLMWNRTGLPAVFPLQVKTRAGRDYYLKLVDARTGQDALAAFIKGGAFFKVLVPPGEFRLIFASGTTWKGEGDLFGPGALTHEFELENTLMFQIRNPGIKAGHIVDLRSAEPGDPVLVVQRPQLICQTLQIERAVSRYPGYRLRASASTIESRFVWPWYEKPRRPNVALMFRAVPPGNPSLDNVSGYWFGHFSQERHGLSYAPGYDRRFDRTSPFRPEYIDPRYRVRSRYCG